ncbi:MAG: hypothetical protein A2086_01260 [Spirochaetes bacterium GWD1_27_9]|nr:MAG: hypothetical protein A2Z98_13050 [Spirochaetes bacterium GWB1_27_13]OHD44347.1 MAG: hypothetical protein A2086_01260 [Spirochaetes bacterium GWD1_27_9]
MSLEPKVFYKGEYLIKENDEDKSMYIIVEGRVKILMTDNTTKQKVEVAILKNGDFVGESALLFDKPRTATVIADTDTKVIEMHKKEQLIEYIKQNPEFAIGMIMILVNRVEKMTESYIQTYGNLQFAKNIISESLELSKKIK